MTSEDVLAAGTRQHRTELRDLHGTDQRVQSADYPRREEQHRVRQVSRDLPRGAQDAGADGVADGHRQTETNAQHLQQASTTRRVALHQLVTLWLLSQRGLEIAM